MITRVYDPTEGEILVDGKNLKEYNLFSWQQSIAALFQDYTVYLDESIKQNITLSEEKVDTQLMQKVVKDSMVIDFASKYEKGIDQMIGNEFRGGVELSKGQSQKVALARTLYHNRPVIILDEPTSAIDAMSEDYIFNSIRENYKDKTRILISHKFSNVRSADKIILIQEGEILEMGTHVELIQKAGRYKELFELQAKGYE
jgi:ATP-binding cassette subfamily B protein